MINNVCIFNQQGLCILYLTKLFRAKKFHIVELGRARERIREAEASAAAMAADGQTATVGFKEAFASEDNAMSEHDQSGSSDDDRVGEGDHDNIELLERRRGSQPDLVRTPVSILKDTTSE